MLNSFTRTANYYLQFYSDFAEQSWDAITFWQYIGLMATTLFVGYLWLMKGSTGHS